MAAPSGTATGTVTAIGAASLTIQTAGRRTGVIDALTADAAAVARRDYPYVWGGGHAEAGVASIGIKGPGYNGRRVGYDCSGSVGAVLAGAGLWPAGSPVPSDAGIITQLLQERLIARGPGKAPDEVTLYDDPGVHIFMNIDGRFFGTSDGGGGNAKGGPTWLDDSAQDASNSAFKRYHVLPAVLNDQTTYGHSLTFKIDPQAATIGAFAAGDKVRVSYVEAGSGAMIARSIGLVGAITTSGSVASIAPDGQSFTVETASGRSLTFSIEEPELIDGLQVGDTVQVIYTKSVAGTLLARSLTVTATPVVSQVNGTITTIAPGLGSFTLQTSGGQEMTFSTGGLPSVIAGLQAGEQVQVNYTQLSDGSLTALQVIGSESGGGSPGGGSYGGGYQ